MSGRWRPGRRVCGLCAAALLCAVAGCASSPSTTFIVLSSRMPAQGRQAYDGPPVMVGRVALPAQLDRDALVRQAGPNKLAVAGTVRWSAPLDELVRQTLTDDLAQRLPTGKVVLPGQPAGSARVFVVTLQTFAVDASGQAQLAAAWQLDTPGQQTVLRGHTQLAVAARSESSADAAGALSTALGRMADQMARRLAGAPAPQ